MLGLIIMIRAKHPRKWSRIIDDMMVDLPDPEGPNRIPDFGSDGK
jgi:hypothetical protein